MSWDDNSDGSIDVESNPSVSCVCCRCNTSRVVVRFYQLSNGRYALSVPRGSFCLGDSLTMFSVLCPSCLVDFR